jgi:hypothetical protein
LIRIQRRSFEGLIALALQNLKNAELELCERYKQLRNAPREVRAAFMTSLWELDRRVSSLERLLGERIDNS